MNKTIIININGTVFHIEEDAYEILKAYMTDVKRHFMNSADSLEITTDIENRIAEMFNEVLIRDGRQALVEQDVKLVVEQMGSVADFENAEDDGKGESAAFAPYNSTPRKLFRDPDDHLLGGVCAGVANYFDFKPVWVRFIFFILTWFFGTGFLAYVILWIVVPKAITRTDRMAMKGEKLNLQGFKKNFEDEMTSVQNNVKQFGDQSRPFVYKSRDFVGDFFRHLGTFINQSGSLFIKFIGICILLSSFVGLIALVVTVITFLFYGSNEIYNIFPFNIVNYETNTVFLLCGFLMLAIPLLTIILLIVSALFKNNTFNRATGFGFLTIWIAALSIVIYYTAKATANFRYEASFQKNISLKPSSTGIYHLKLNDIKYFSKEDSLRLQVKDRFNGMIIIDNNNDDDFDSPGRTVNIEIEKSDIATPVLVQSFSARGHDYEEALTNARNTTYPFVQQDSILKFPRSLQRLAGKLWRNQEVHLTLRLPLNSKVVIDNEIDGYVNRVDLYGCKIANNDDMATSATFVMTATGLECKVDTLIIPETPKDSIVIKKP